MSRTTDNYIRTVNDTREEAYTQIEDAIRNLYLVGTAESAIILSVRIIYRDIIDKETEK